MQYHHCKIIIIIFCSFKFFKNLDFPYFCSIKDGSKKTQNHSLSSLNCNTSKNDLFCIASKCKHGYLEKGLCLWLGVPYTLGIVHKARRRRWWSSPVLGWQFLFISINPSIIHLIWISLNPNHLSIWVKWIKTHLVI